MQYNTQNLSDYALKLLTLQTQSVIYTRELQSWDGIDECGAEIVIYDMLLILDNSGNTEESQPLRYQYNWYRIEYYTAEINPIIEYILDKTEYHSTISPDITSF
jgi:transposase-like protein